MKNILRQIAVIVTVLATITVNILANALPINGRNTGAISDNFQVYFVPAGYVFSIWGLIYIGLIAYAVYQALPSQRNNPRLTRTGWWVVLGNLANISWIFLWHYGLFVGTLGAMLILLATLIVTYLGLRTGQTKISPAEAWTVRIPFSIYLGWITVATVANVTDVLDYLNWDRFGLTPETWMLIILGAVFVIATLMNLIRRDVAYASVIVWALIGISIKHADVAILANATRWTTALVAVTLAAGMFLNPNLKKS